LPTANEFIKYESALPGAADRILKIAEKEAEHRHENEDKIITESLKLSTRGLNFSFIISVLSLIAVGMSVFLSQPAAAIAPAIIAITGLASTFINRKK
jgi:uncharacterized membrane protein